MFDFWEALKYVIKEKISQFKLGVRRFFCFKLGVRRFFCKHHYVEEKILWHGVPGIYYDGVKCTKCGKIAEKEEWMTIEED